MPLDLATQFWTRISKTGSCWLWTGGKFTNGYGGLAGKKAHRISYELHSGPIPPRMVVMHTCDHPACVNPAHLKLGTQADNIADRVSKGRSWHKLTNDEVREIRDARARGTPLKDVATRYGVSVPTICLIARGTRRTHV